MKLYYRDPKTGEYKEERDAQLDRHGQPITDVLFAVPDAPGAAREGFAQVWVPDGSAGKYPAEVLTLSAQGTGGGWYYIEDHRRHVTKQGVKEGGTEHWLPSAGDTWLSSPRFMEELGPLPDGAVTTRPEQPAEEKLADAKRAKTAEFNLAMADIDARLVRPTADIVHAMLAPEAVSEEDTTTDDFDQSRMIFAKLRDLQAQNRVLRAQIESAQTVEEVQAIEPVTPHTAASRSAESVRRYYLA